MSASIWDRSYTPVHFPASGLQLKPDRPFFLWGSCFARELADYLDSRLLRQRFSFLGITYNPFSLAQGLRLLSDPREFREDELFFHQQQWKHPLFHGHRNHPDKKTYIESVRQDLESAENYLKEKPLMVLTLGSAWVYRRKSDGQAVNNCHRQEAALFRRELAGTAEMKQALSESMESLRKEFPGLEWVLTVSPVRHLRDAAAENSLSKARLICTAQELAMEREDCRYFPSWEIMMDELRDYRWYGPNLKNPSPEAVEYIMGRFMDWSASEELRQWLPRAESLRKRLNHRPLGRDPGADQLFQEQTRREWDQLKQTYPHLETLCIEGF